MDRSLPRRWAKRLLGPLTVDELAIVGSMLTGSGTLVDVGAHYGTSLEPFARRGWQVIAVEPDPQNRARIPHFPNVTVDPRAIAELDGERVTLFTSDVSTGISTLTPFHASHHASTEVETVRLDTLLADCSEVTLLKTDLEGWDLPALRTFPWDRLHPQAVVAEFENRKTVPLGYTYRDLADFLVARGYSVIVSEWYPIIEYGQRHRWRRMVRWPAQVAAEGWGNMIAVVPHLADRVMRSGPRLAARLATLVR